MSNGDYGFSGFVNPSAVKTKQPTDYAKAQGVNIDTTADYAGNSIWYLRSADIDYSHYVSCVSCDGVLHHEYGIDKTSGGIVPALTIRLN